MDFIDKKLEDYARKHSTPEPEILRELERETWMGKLYPRMLSGHLQGTFLSMISRMLRPVRILEIGTFTGYSAIALAAGLDEKGKLFTIEVNPEHVSTAKKYFKKAGLENKIETLAGNAVQVIPGLKENWDLIFIDADKENYLVYYDLLIDRLKPGAWIIADNVLWDGKVLNAAKADKQTLGIIKFNETVQADSRVENMLLPFRDGLMLIRKK